MRDITAKQFAAALARHGMKGEGWMGYVNVNIPGHHLCVSMFNAGDRRRDQLAYLLRERDQWMAECSRCEHMKIDHMFPEYKRWSREEHAAAGHVNEYANCGFPQCQRPKHCACRCGCAEFIE